MGAMEIGYICIAGASIALFLLVNRHLFSTQGGGRLSLLQRAYIIMGIAGLAIGWYHNVAYFYTYPDTYGWWHWTVMLFANPASASGGQDLLIANLLLFPLWTVVDGRRMNMKWGWYYLPLSLITSYAFGVAMYLVMRERQKFHNHRVA